MRIEMPWTTSLKNIVGLLLKTKKLSILIFVLVTIYTVTSVYKLFTPENRKINADVLNELKRSLKRDIGEGCEMLYLDPFSSDVKTVIDESVSIICDGFDWVECFGENCYVVPKILKKYDKVSCTYRDIIYLDDSKHVIGEPSELKGRDVYRLTESDHVKVTCTGKKHGHKTVKKWEGYKAGFRDVKKNDVDGRGKSINIQIIAFAAISKNGFIRSMPESYKMLTQELGAVVFERYNVLGAGSGSSIFPLLTGRSELELPEMDPENFIDDRKFIFHLLHRDGFRTAFLEDLPWNNPFMKHSKGFKKQPTDHYMQAFFNEESTDPVKFWSSVKAKYCVGAVPQYYLLLNLTHQFLQLPGKRFGYTLMRDITRGDSFAVSKIDDDMAMFLDKYKSGGRMDETMLIVMANYGFRFPKNQHNLQTKIEERMPFFAIVLPDRLKSLRPGVESVVRANAQVLATPFDIHTTILDALNLDIYKNKFKVPGANLNRGLSLLQPIPKYRSCSEAGVLARWCACAKWYDVLETNEMYRRTAEVLVEYINNLTFNKRPECVVRELTAIQSVKNLSPNDDLLFTVTSRLRKSGSLSDDEPLAKLNTQFYRVKVVLGPNHVVYGGSIRYNLMTDFFSIQEKDIIRISRYENEAECLDESHVDMKRFCFCKTVRETKKCQTCNLFANPEDEHKT